MASRSHVAKIYNTEAAADTSRTQLRALGTETIRHIVAGVLTAAAGVIKYSPGYAAEIVDVKARVGTAPTGADLLVDVNKNGTTIFTTQAARPSIAINGTVSTNGTPAVTSLAATDELTVDVDQIGSTVAGSDLTVEIHIRPAKPSNR